MNAKRIIELRVPVNQSLEKGVALLRGQMVAVPAQLAQLDDDSGETYNTSQIWPTISRISAQAAASFISNVGLARTKELGRGTVTSSSLMQ
jgi:hypothetical protein